jgi:O-antigen/teichoic acid export membrane protein
MSAHVEISKRLVTINAASTAIRRILSITVLVWLQQHLLRRITPEEYSLLPVLMALMMFVPLIPALLSSGMGRFVTEAYARGDEGRVTQIVSTMFPVLSGAAVFLCAVGWTAAWNVDHILEIAPERVDEARIMLGLLVAGAAAGIALSPFTMALNVQQKIVQANLISLGVEVLRVVLLLILLNALGTEVLWVIVSSVVAGVSGLLVTCVISRRLMPTLRFRPREARRELIRPLLSFGTWATVGQLSQTVREVMDPLILHKMATPVDVNAFAVGSSVDFHLRRVIFEAASSAQTPLTAMHATGEEERLKRTYFRMGRYTLWILLFAGVPLVVFRNELIAVYLKETAEVYASASIVMALLLARFVIIFPNSVMAMTAIARNQLKSLNLRSVVFEATNLGLTFYLVGSLKMGAVGSALSTIIVTVTLGPLLYWSFGLQVVGARLGPWLKATLRPGVVPALAAAPVWLALQHFATPRTWLTLGLEAAAGCAVYLFVLIAFCLRDDERGELRAALAKVRSRFS